jgi:hypothetical protein
MMEINGANYHVRESRDSAGTTLMNHSIALPSSIWDQEEGDHERR